MLDRLQLCVSSPKIAQAHIPLVIGPYLIFKVQNPLTKAHGASCRRSEIRLGKVSVIEYRRRRVRHRYCRIFSLSVRRFVRVSRRMQQFEIAELTDGIILPTRLVKDS